MTQEKALDMKEDCEKQASKFSLEEFEKQINIYIK
jgi:hypothetical protein